MSGLQKRRKELERARLMAVEALEELRNAIASRKQGKRAKRFYRRNFWEKRL